MFFEIVNKNSVSLDGWLAACNKSGFKVLLTAIDTLPLATHYLKT